MYNFKVHVFILVNANYINVNICIMSNYYVYRFLYV